MDDVEACELFVVCFDNLLERGAGSSPSEQLLLLDSLFLAQA
jgi:hypothetical protein